MSVRRSHRLRTFGWTLAFWLLIPIPLWLLAAGFSNSINFVPQVSDIVGLLFWIAFYLPPLVMIFLAIDWLRSRKMNQNAQD